MDAERISHRNRRSLPTCELTTLFNATLLLAIFPIQPRLNLIFDDVEVRQKAATFAGLIVMNRQSLLGACPFERECGNIRQCACDT